MKEKIIILALTLFFMIIALFFFKTHQEEKEDNHTINYSFYKENLKEDYLLYQKKTNLPMRQAILEVNIGLNKKFYETKEEAKDKDKITILVNKYHYLDKNYQPQNLVSLNKYAKNGLKLVKEAQEAFINMARDAEKVNLHLRVISAYRSFTYQENLYSNYLKNEDQDIVDTYSARPGYSEHQTGLAIDIDNVTLSYNQFHLTEEFQWVNENAHKYGFILRYPLGKERITGYKYEPWHYRYIGKDIAQYIYQKNLTYEEYYYEFLDK